MRGLCTRAVILVLVVGMLAGYGVSDGCGSSGSTTGVRDAAGSSTTLTGNAAVIAQGFADLAASLSIPIYGLADPPAGAALVASWWPVIEVTSAADYTGPAVANPRVLNAGGSEPEVQMILDYQGASLDILENFRGDLGDVTGTVVGSVAGHTATFYEVNGGMLVQWSDEGHWYGVFGRGVSRKDLIRIALDMKLVLA
jgi:hypothetical protein